MRFEEQLEMQLGDYVSIMITAGEGCCKHEGILCSIMEDYIVLIDGDQRIEIPMNCIAAMRKFAGGAPEMY
jgi:ribosome maturation factor RimP